MPDGTTIEVHNQAKVVSSISEFVQITSTERVNLDAKEQADVRFSITRKQHNLYKKMDLTSTDLDELVGFQTNLDTTERPFGKYDLHQIFMVVDPERDNSGRILPSLKAGSRYRNLFQWYAVLKVEDITTSNRWYRTYPTATW
jgi:hypothetical protein